jgi:RNA polymerase sigma-70 factor (ECF subfamily)
LKGRAYSVCKDRNMEDNELLLSCLEGDLENFKILMDKFRGKSLALAWNILGNREDAEDACQEAFVQVYLNLEKFDFTKNFKDWFFTILSNRCLDQLRKRTRFIKFFKAQKVEFKERMYQTSSNPEHSPLISSKLIQKLNPKERISVCLWANEGYTSDEIASVLRCAPSTARVHLFKARRKIKTLLEEGNVAL